MPHRLMKSDINEITRKLKILERESTNRRVFNNLARLTRSVLFKRVKAGGGADNGRKTKLAKLEKSTIEVRKGEGIMRTFNKKRTVFIPGIDGRPDSLGSFFSPNRSNLTFSGQLLDSIDFKVKKRQGFTLFIPNTQRQPYQNHDVLNKKAPPTNRQLAKWLQKGRNFPTRSKPRPFFELTKGETRIIIKRYNDIIKTLIRRNRL